jgi:hypothetical protein
MAKQCACQHVLWDTLCFQNGYDILCFQNRKCVQCESCEADILRAGRCRMPAQTIYLCWLLPRSGGQRAVTSISKSVEGVYLCLVGTTQPDYLSRSHQLKRSSERISSLFGGQQFHLGTPVQPHIMGGPVERCRRTQCLRPEGPLQRNHWQVLSRVQADLAQKDLLRRSTWSMPAMSIPPTPEHPGNLQGGSGRSHHAE